MKIDRDSLYSLDELSQLTGISVRTLQRFTASGDLPTRRIGKRVFVLGSDLLEGLPKGVPAPVSRPKSRRKPKGQGS